MKSVLLFSAFSGAGKTTYISKLIPYFIKNGYHIGYIKHHHGKLYEKKVKDTGWIHRSGVDRTLLIAEDMLVIEDNPGTPQDPIKEYIQRYFSNYHLVIVEGFKHDKRYPKIILLRKWHPDAYNTTNDPNAIAIVSDLSLNTSLPVFGFEEKESLFHFIINYFKLGK